MTITSSHPSRFARAVRAACNAVPWEPGCDYPKCERNGYICWNGEAVGALRAFIEEWETPQRLEPGK